MDLNIEISILDIEEFSDLWEVFDEMILDNEVPQHYRTRLKAIRAMIDSEDTRKKFPDTDE